jgi:hypothetical protein
VVTGITLNSIGPGSYRLLNRTKDPQFDIDRLEYYSLSLFIGHRDFQILIKDNESGYALLLEDMVLDPKITEKQKREVLKFIFDDHHLLLANFWKSINLVVKNQLYSFVPFALFDESSAASYLQSHTPFAANEDEIMLTYHQHYDLVNVFGVPRWIREMLTQIYAASSFNFQHQSGAIIDGMNGQNQGRSRSVLLFVDRFMLHFVVLEEKKLIYCNQFPIRKFRDYTHYISVVNREFGLDTDIDKITLYGFLGDNTPHFQELRKHFVNISFGKRPTYVKLGHVFDEIREHQYFDLFSALPQQH